MTLQIDQWTVEVIKKPIKNIYLKVRKDGSLQLSVPFGLSKRQMQLFLNDRLDWIQKKQNALPRKQVIDPKTNTYYLGERVPIIVEVSKKKSCTLEEGVLVLQTPNPKGTKKLTEQLLRWHKEKTLEIANPIVNRGLKEMNFDKKLDVKVRKMKKRFGSAHLQKNVILLNSMLSCYPLESIEYVIYHEIVHFLVPNHSKEFYKLVKKYQPDYKNRWNQLINKTIIF